MRRTHVLLAALGLAAAGGLAALPVFLTPTPAGGGALAPPPAVLAAGDAAADAPVAAARKELPAAPASAAPDFAALLARLVELAARGVAEVRAGRIEEAKATDAEALRTFADIRTAFADAGERAVFLLQGLPEGGDTRVAVERAMLRRLIESALRERHEAGAPAASRLAALVALLLDALAQSERLAAELAPLLAGSPYLGASHEDAVLRLAELIPVAPFLRQHAPALIATLWANLERSGARRGSDLELLALMLKDDTNPAKRSAALQRLLGAENERLVDFVLGEVERSADTAMARELAVSAASALPPERALAVLQRLRRVEDTPLTAATLTLAGRDAPALREAYERLAAEGLDGPLRADLVTGLGFHPSPENLALTRFAFEQDPDPEVRARALLALSSSAALGEQALGQALDDHAFLGGNGERMPVVISGIQNLAGAGEVNAVARLGQRLLARPGLARADRAELERILARTLPPGLRQGW